MDGGVYRIEPPARCSGVDPAARAWLNANIMSLGGIAISIGVLVDGAIVEVENGPSDEGAGAAWPAARCD